MRIRKNMKLSSLLFQASSGGGERSETHVCHLNQSPWDVIQFSYSSSPAAVALSNVRDSSWFLPSSPSSSPHFHQVRNQLDEGDSFNGNVSLGDSNGAAESVVLVEKLDFMTVDGDDDEKSADGKQAPWTRNGSNIKGKKSKAHEPNSLQKSSGNKTSAATTSTAPPRRGRPRGTVKKASAAAETTNPYEFYYYSGFGPRWGKRRGVGSGRKSGAEEETVLSSSGISMINNSSSVGGGGKIKENVEGNGTASFDEDEEDYMEEDEEGDQNDDSVNMKKRARKPVKARSLKSLM